MKSKQLTAHKKGIIFVLICAILVGVIFAASLSYSEKKEVADVFYLQIYNDDNEVASKYQIALTGEASSEGSEILTVSFDCVSGDTCETSYTISGSYVTLTITHPEYGYLTKKILLDTGGTFSVLE